MHSYSETIDHFSHQHSLNLVYTAQQGRADLPLCSACKTRASGSTYKCGRHCHFFIHAWCASLPRIITHPAHFQPRHQLQLLTTPAHMIGSFRCDGCGHHGDGFSYRCISPGCDFDLHILCAAKPLMAAHCSHGHQLSLTFGPPYNSGTFCCNICGTAGSNHWLYRCGSCNFNAHIGCVEAAEYSSTHLSPSWPQPRQQGLMVPAGVGASIASPIFVLGPQGTGPGGINYSQPSTATTFAGGLMVSAAQGFVQGAAQQEGQCLVQNLMGSSSSGGGSFGDGATSGDIFSTFDFW